MGEKQATGADSPQLHGFTVTDDSTQRTARVYVDAQSGLMRRIIIPESKGDFTIQLGAYHNTNGVPLPGSLQITQNGKTFVTLTFDAFAINKPIDDALFAKPK
jgi:hypothetical protein